MIKEIDFDIPQDCCANTLCAAALTGTCALFGGESVRDAGSDKKYKVIRRPGG
ncbi:hypothetical protein [Chryseolinea lacunae]|uniref:hypothetical protein n=1 Tax=Chryseolinea lacunae TaxID=2801331 RepID=UPI001F2A47B3|nr:hypothetical protein [Chryseolinea lacunae]